MTMHKEPNSKEEIPELCKQSFLTIGKALAILWILAGLLISMSVTGVTYAFATEKSLTEMKSAQNMLQEQINNKLDILIKQKEK